MCGDRSYAAGHGSLPPLLFAADVAAVATTPNAASVCGYLYMDEPYFPWQSRLRNEMKRLEGDRAGVREITVTKRRFYGGDRRYFLGINTCSERFEKT